MSPMPSTTMTPMEKKSVFAVLSNLFRHPIEGLFKKWNGKAALLSSLLRASLFFAANLSAGLPAALAALYTELIFRAMTSGCYGALTEAFREAGRRRSAP